MLETEKRFCETREDLAEKYFNTFGDGVKSDYAKGNMGIITLLSDIQERTQMLCPNEHWNGILNDIKSVLCTDNHSDS